MPYKDGSWGEKAKLRSNGRRQYFRDRAAEIRHSTPGNFDSIGYIGEELGLHVLVGSKKIGRPCDLDWRGKLVDVKTALPTNNTNGGKPRWKFLLTKQKGIADFFLIICKNIDNTVQYIFLILDKDIKYKNLSFSSEGALKYSKYLLTL